MLVTTRSREAISIRSPAAERHSRRQYVWWVKDDLDVGAMRRTAAHFVGLHDFQSFSDDDPDEKSTQVQVERNRHPRRGAI